MQKINYIFYMYSNMDRSSQILLFLITLVSLMLLSIFIINAITKRKDEKYDRSVSNIKKYSDLLEKEKIQLKDDKEKDNDELQVVEVVSEDNSIEEISKLIEENLEQNPIDLTKFEEDQEKDAIISYDELVKKAGAKKIVYKLKEKEEQIEVLADEPISEPKKFKASQIVSPIYGIQKEKPTNIDTFIDIDNYKLKNEDDNEDIQMKNDMEFLNSLKTFRSEL